jgi:hypothetical protein
MMAGTTAAEQTAQREQKQDASWSLPLVEVDVKRELNGVAYG